MSTDRQSIGCVAMIAGALIIGGAIVYDSKSSNEAPVLSQPKTGPVRRDPPVAATSSYNRDSAPIPALSPVFAKPVYTPPVPPPLTRSQILDSNPIQTEPISGLQGQSSDVGNDSALKLINHLPSPAYVKVLNGSGTTVATIYLRVQESHELELPAGSYLVKYASGSASQWRGPINYFGSTTSFHKGDYKNIGTNEILSLTFYQIVTRGSSAGGTPTISAEEFDR